MWTRATRLLAPQCSHHLRRITCAGDAVGREYRADFRAFGRGEFYVERKLGQELELFMFSERVGQGLPIWLPKGTAVRSRLEDFLKATKHIARIVAGFASIGE